MFANCLPDVNSTINLLEIARNGQPPGGLKITRKIHPCYVSLHPQLQPSPCQWLTITPTSQPEYTLGEDRSELLTYEASNKSSRYDLDEHHPGISIVEILLKTGLETGNSRERNIVRFDGHRGTDTEFFFLAISCREHTESYHCCGLILRAMTRAPDTYRRAGVGWLTDLLCLWLHLFEPDGLSMLLLPVFFRKYGPVKGCGNLSYHLSSIWACIDQRCSIRGCTRHGQKRSHW